jgi:protein phosphatase
MAENRLITGIKLANKQIFDASLSNHEVHGMGTTVVGALFSRERKAMYVAHVGDSRCYLVRGGVITQLTRDHSLLNDYLLVMPDMTKEQQAELPKNVITRALGMQDTVTVDIVPAQPQRGDRYLLCSDGLSGMLTDDEIRDLVATEKDLELVVKRLIESANEHGGEDNCTVVLLAVEE